MYNHQHAIVATLQEVMTFGHQVLLVDDGSDAQCRDVLQALAQQHSPQVALLRLQQNGGKGCAVKAGLKELAAMGHSHALQVDADGQHNLSDIPEFIARGEVSPDLLIAGHPEYNDSVSKGRLYSRYLTHIWVWINTLSFAIKDSMCGFRLYPLREINSLLSKEPCGDRMDFDTEIIVRWLWNGGQIENLHTKVNYPLDGVSHFNLLHDNLLISWMHTRLFFGMLRRLPHLLMRKF